MSRFMSIAYMASLFWILSMFSMARSVSVCASLSCSKYTGMSRCPKYPRSSTKAICSASFHTCFWSSDASNCICGCFPTNESEAGRARASRSTPATSALASKASFASSHVARTAHLAPSGHIRRSWNLRSTFGAPWTRATHPWTWFRDSQRTQARLPTCRTVRARIFGTFGKPHACAKSVASTAIAKRRTLESAMATRARDEASKDAKWTETTSGVVGQVGIDAHRNVHVGLQ
mmetsp:Transcript_4691/g.29590  ORF Transcript_4691/g.29590 Transcript_4691/m.29590 type:complete len:233 (-) Transcript_4691:1325-2023(-)